MRFLKPSKKHIVLDAAKGNLSCMRNMSLKVGALDMCSATLQRKGGGGAMFRPDVFFPGLGKNTNSN